MPQHDHRFVPARPAAVAGVLAFALAAVLGLAATAAAQAPVPAQPASLDAILAELSSYNGGTDSAAVWKLRDYVRAHGDDPAARAGCELALLKFLEKTSATPAAKMTVCRHLHAIGSDSAVPVLRNMLASERTADMALYALQGIPGPVADRALLDALAFTTGPTRAAIVASLGERRCVGAVPALARLLHQPALAGPAAVALGRIGSTEAATALVSAHGAAHPNLEPVIAGAVMSCAERSVAARDEPAALRLYDALLSDAALPVAVRRAATMGKIGASGPGASAVLMEALGGADEGAQEAAVAMIGSVLAPDAIAPVCALLPRLPERARVQVLAVLSGYPTERVLSAILDAARGDAPAVRVAAVKALASAGDASVVPFLAERAAATRGQEQAAARSTLGGLKGRQADEAIAARLSDTQAEAVRVELLLAAASRRIYAARSLVAASLSSPSRRVRAQALQALRAIGTPSDVPAVLTLLVASADESEQAEAEATTAALARKIAGAEGRADTVHARLAAEKAPAARARLIGVLPLVGDDSSLPLLRRALADGSAEVSDAAVRAVSAWPTSAARDDVFRLARDSKEDTHRLLAIRGFVRMIGLEKYREPAAAVADLRAAAAFSSRQEEQVLILGTLAQFPCSEALDLAGEFARTPSVKAEAEAATAKIRAALQAGGKA